MSDRFYICYTRKIYLRNLSPLVVMVQACHTIHTWCQFEKYCTSYLNGFVWWWYLPPLKLCYLLCFREWSQIQTLFLDGTFTSNCEAPLFLFHSTKGMSMRQQLKAIELLRRSKLIYMSGAIYNFMEWWNTLSYTFS